MSKENIATVEYYFITPCGNHVVTRYQAISDDDAWSIAAKHFCVIPADRPAWIVKAKLDGFRMSTRPPVQPTADRWRHYNDLVELRNALWSVVPPPDVPGGTDQRWTILTDGFTKLVDQNSRLRYWLEWVLTAEPEELEQWRNGEYAAKLVNAEVSGQTI